MRSACPTCRGTLDVVHPESEAVVCGACHTVSHTGQGALVPQGKTDPFVPALAIPIGTTGRLDDGEWTVLGAWRQAEAGWYWDALVLGRTGAPLKYLGYDRHRFKWYEPVAWNIDIEERYQRARRSRGRDTSFFEEGKGRLIAVAGEVPWPAVPGEITAYVAFPTLTIEVSERTGEREASRPVPVPHEVLRRAFGLSLGWRRWDWTTSAGLTLRGPSAGGRVARVGAAVGAGVLVVSGIGWSAHASAHPGLDPAQLAFERGSTRDSAGGDAWRGYCTSDACAAAWGVTASDPYGAWQKRTLLAALDRVRQVVTPMSEARAPFPLPDWRRMGREAWPERALIVVDLNGDASVMVGASLAAAGKARPVCTFNNWPHQWGLVRCERTLAALVAFAGEVETARRALPSDAPPALLCERERLRRFTERPDRVYDNRYGLLRSDLPAPAELAARGIASVVYVSPDFSRSESDDLNAWFMELRDAGCTFSRAMLDTQGDLELQSWRPAARTVSALPPALPRASGSAGGPAVYRPSGTRSHGFFG